MHKDEVLYHLGLTAHDPRREAAARRAAKAEKHALAGTLRAVLTKMPAAERPTLPFKHALTSDCASTSLSRRLDARSSGEHRKAWSKLRDCRSLTNNVSSSSKPRVRFRPTDDELDTFASRPLREPVRRVSKADFWSGRRLDGLLRRLILGRYGRLEHEGRPAALKDTVLSDAVRYVREPDLQLDVIETLERPALLGLDTVETSRGLAYVARAPHTYLREGEEAWRTYGTRIWFNGRPLSRSRFFALLGARWAAQWFFYVKRGSTYEAALAENVFSFLREHGRPVPKTITVVGQQKPVTFRETLALDVHGQVRQELGHAMNGQIVAAYYDVKFTTISDVPLDVDVMSAAREGYRKAVATHDRTAWRTLYGHPQVRDYVIAHLTHRNVSLVYGVKKVSD